MMPEQPTQPLLTRNVDRSRCQHAAVASWTHVALFEGVQRRQQRRVVTEHPGPVSARKSSGVRNALVWLCLVIVIEVAVGHALQLAAANSIAPADTNVLALPMDLPSAQGTCPALDQYVVDYVHRALTIDELHDLQDQLCPALSEPQRTGN